MQPLFLYGISFLIGVLFKPLLLFPLVSLLYFSNPRRLLFAILVVLTGFFWHKSTFTPPSYGIHLGKGWLHITECSRKTYHGKPRHSYKGVLKEFQSEDGLYKNIPVILSLSEKAPPQENDWEVYGTLKHSPKGFIFKPDPDKPWKALKGTYSIAEFRFKMKEKVKNWVLRSISLPKVASLLGGLITGDFDDRILQQNFSSLGLTHLLAISGFHFTLIAAIFSLLLMPFFSLKTRSYILIFMLGTYCLFLGGAPSILRAFLTLFLFLFAPLINEQSNSESSLGATLLLLLTLDPLYAHSMGFQLSFLATGAILFFVPYFEGLVNTYLPKRDKKALYALSMKDRITAVIFSFIKKSITLNLSITLILLPVILALFKEFPLASLIYNLFYPFFLSLSILFLILSLFIPWLHYLNAIYTEFLLDIAQEIPPQLAITFRSRAITEELSIIILTILFTFIFHKKRSLKYTIRQINL